MGWRVGAVLSVVLSLALLVSLCGSRSGTRGATADASLGWGMTHTQYSAADGDPSTVDTAVRALSAQSLPQNQHIMGWGADNPEPSPATTTSRPWTSGSTSSEGPGGHPSSHCAVRLTG